MYSHCGDLVISIHSPVDIVLLTAVALIMRQLFALIFFVISLRIINTTTGFEKYVLCLRTSDTVWNCIS